MKFHSSTYIRFALLSLLLLSGCKKKAPVRPLLPEIAFKALPTQTAVALKPTTVDDFADWVATMPSSQVDEVKQQIALANSDPAVVDAVVSRLSFVHPRSYGYQLIYLSILGELKNERALAPLISYLNSKDCRVFEERATLKTPVGARQTSLFDGCAGLKSAAVNMIAYLNTPAARAAVFAAVHGHPSRSVRLSAIDAFLYNNGDSPEALAAARRMARPEEVKFVGLPRLTAETNPREFEAKLNRFYQDHPEERPQPVQRVRGGQSPSSPNSPVKKTN